MKLINAIRRAFPKKSPKPINVEEVNFQGASSQESLTKINTIDTMRFTITLVNGGKILEIIRPRDDKIISFHSTPIPTGRSPIYILKDDVTIGEQIDKILTIEFLTK